MGIRKTLAELVLAASLLLPSCSKVEKETVYVDQWQNPIMYLRAVSSDNRFVGLSFNQSTDVEACVFDSETKTLSNVSRDPANTDFPFGFLGGNLVTMCAPQNGEFEQFKIYNSSGNQIYETQKFSHSREFMIHSDSMFVIEASDVNADKVYLFDLNTMSLTDMIPSGKWNYIHEVAQDGRVIFIRSHSDAGDTSVYVLKSGVLSLVSNDPDYDYVERVSDNGKKAFLYSWSHPDMLKVFDTDTSVTQNVVMPFGSTLNEIISFSQDGLCALVTLDESSGEHIYHLNTSTSEWRMVCSVEDDLGFFGISKDGSVAAFDDYKNDCVVVFKESTPELYAVQTDFSYTMFKGFTFDNRLVLAGWGETQEEYLVLIHNPLTKTNSSVVNSNYEYRNCEMLPNREYLVIDALESGTSNRVVILEDLVAGTSKVIKQDGVNLRTIDASFDGNYIFFSNDGSTNNLFGYQMSTGNLVQITNNPSGWQGSFNILDFQNNGNPLYFENEYLNGTKELMCYKFDTKELTKISN